MSTQVSLEMRRPRLGMSQDPAPSLEMPPHEVPVHWPTQPPGLELPLESPSPLSPTASSGLSAVLRVLQSLHHPLEAVVSRTVSMSVGDSGQPEPTPHSSGRRTLGASHTTEP